MPKYLVIVESPTKERTISRLLGKNYVVRSSYGHVRDLPTKELGVDEESFDPTYTILPRAKKLIPIIKALADKSDRLYLATDYDREGESIAWHVVQLLKIPQKKIFRITFHEITPDAIQRAIESPRQINMNLVHAQQARRVLDRLVGYKISPILWKKLRRGLSAGRVQSVSVRFITEREKEIEKFSSELYWTLKGIFHKEDGSEVPAELTHLNRAKVDLHTTYQLFSEEYKVRSTTLKSRMDLDKLIDRIKGKSFKVVKVVKSVQRRRPAAPFNTASLTQDASYRIGFTAARTMRVAQSLYEGIKFGDQVVGLITYMRTDSVSVAKEAVDETRKYIKKVYGENHLPTKPPVYKTKTRSAQEAHECIRPSGVFRTPKEVVDQLTREQAALYKLIHNRFVASQMTEALFDSLSADITLRDKSQNIQEVIFHAKGRVLKFQGFLAVYEDMEDNSEDQPTSLPPLENGDLLESICFEPKEHKTSPPPRYNEASLIRALEENGIGRPSTYAPTLETILARGYVRLEERRFYPTEMGTIVTEKLLEFFPGIVDLSFTARMEKLLDEIAESNIQWKDVIKEFYVPFLKNLAVAEKSMPEVKIEPKDSGEKCPKCQGRMLLRESRFGRYLSCEDFPQCRSKIALDRSGNKILPELTQEPCPKCSKMMEKRRGRWGKFYLCCPDYPQCKTTYALDREGNKIVRPPPESTDQVCEKCGKMMLKRVGARGPFIACSGFPRCRNIKKITAETNSGKSKKPSEKIEVKKRKKPKK